MAHDSDYWEADKPGACWVCRERTTLVYLDMGYQHRDCMAWPNEDGTHSRIIRGGREERTR